MLSILIDITVKKITSKTYSLTTADRRRQNLFLFLWDFPKAEFQGQLQSLGHSLSESGEQMNETQLKQTCESPEHETCRDKATYDLYSKMSSNSYARNE